MTISTLRSKSSDCMSAEINSVFPELRFDATLIENGTLIRCANSIAVIIVASSFVSSAILSILCRDDKMSCCPTTMSKQEFIEQKLKNLKAFLTPYCSTPELLKNVEVYNSVESVMPWLYQANAMVRVGQIEALVNKFCEAFGEAGKTEEFRTRIRRTLQMFADVLSA